LELDPETGLPKLPEGLAWRVSRSRDDGTGVKISIAQEVNGNWVSFEPDIYIYTSPSSTSLKDHSKYLYDKILQKQKQVALVDSVVGLYPPNSL
jgi:hypothetical protein